MKLRFAIAAISAFLVFAPAPAQADVVLTPFVGALFGGDLPDGKPAYGLSAAFMGNGVIGAEVMFNYTPSFVPATSTDPKVSQAGLMANLILGIPIGGDGDASDDHWRPYVTGGVGLHRATAKRADFVDRITSNDFAVNFGGGVMAFFTDHVGIRGDVRYFRTVRDDNGGTGIDFDFGDLDFWKWDVGAAFRF
jgi:opacity protein-like surface antigen